MQYRIRLILLMAAMACTMAVGCGRKGPPVVPQDLPLPPVADLTARIEGKEAVLAWSLSKTSGDLLPESFVIYRAWLGPQSCEGCPLLFQKIGRLNLNAADRPIQQPWRLTWRDPDTPAGRCIYKVTSFRGRRRIADSNLAAVPF